MRDSHLDWIWSRYTSSPDPASGMQSLYQTCSVFTEHVLQPSHILLRGGGFVLHPELAIPLTDVITSMDRLLRCAAKHNKLPQAPFIGQQELNILTVTEGLHGCATQNQIVFNWVLLIDRLALAMRELQWLCIGDDPSQHGWPSCIPGILASLPPQLRAKVPKDFLQTYGITVMPLAASISEAAIRKAPAHRRKDSLWCSDLHHSPEALNDIKAGGLATSQESKGSPRRPRLDTREGAANCVIEITPGKGAVHAPGSPSLSTATTATRDFAHKDTDLSMSDLVNGFTSYPTPAVSLLARTVCIVKLKSLGTQDITDRGIDSALGRFGLETSFFRIVNNTVNGMQSVLTKASSLVPRRTSCFLVDPHGSFMGILRGTNDRAGLQVAWTGLASRIQAAHDSLDKYQQEYQCKCATSANAPDEPSCSRVPAAVPPSTVSGTVGLQGDGVEWCAIEDDTGEHATRPLLSTTPPVFAPYQQNVRAPAAREHTAMNSQVMSLQQGVMLGCLASPNSDAMRTRAANGESDTLKTESSGALSTAVELNGVIGATEREGLRDSTGYGCRSELDQRPAQTQKVSVRTSVNAVPSASRPPSPRSPGPVLDSADTVELGGLLGDAFERRARDDGMYEHALRRLSSPDMPPVVAFALAEPVVNLGTRKYPPVNEESDAMPNELRTSRPAEFAVAANICSESSLHEHALTTGAFTITRVTPSSKSPAPALANADAVELGGLPIEMVVPRAKVSAIEHGRRAQGTTKDGGLRECQQSLAATPLVNDNPVVESVCGASATTSSPSALQLPAPGRIVDALTVELWGLKYDQQIIGTAPGEARTQHARTHATFPAACEQVPSARSPAPAPSFEGGSVELGGLDEKLDEQKHKKATRDGPLFPGARFDADAPSSSVLLTDIRKAKVFALVSVIVRPRDATYLTYIRRGELAPYLAWEREGIGTAPWIC
ncbi:hypothetical protein C8R47DRAFT_1212387 [Mycena vitilis]|nr:hypothetical protein C8R47DRAFT_1212387 [Mycena vitilis]